MGSNKLFGLTVATLSAGLFLGLAVSGCSDSGDKSGNAFVSNAGVQFKWNESEESNPDAKTDGVYKMVFEAQDENGDRVGTNKTVKGDTTEYVFEVPYDTTDHVLVFYYDVDGQLITFSAVTSKDYGTLYARELSSKVVEDPHEFAQEEFAEAENLVVTPEAEVTNVPLDDTFTASAAIKFDAWSYKTGTTEKNDIRINITNDSSWSVDDDILRDVSDKDDIVKHYLTLSEGVTALTCKASYQGVEFPSVSCDVCVIDGVLTAVTVAEPELKLYHPDIYLGQSGELNIWRYYPVVQGVFSKEGGASQTLDLDPSQYTLISSDVEKVKIGEDVGGEYLLETVAEAADPVTVTVITNESAGSIQTIDMSVTVDLLTAAVAFENDDLGNISVGESATNKIAEAYYTDAESNKYPVNTISLLMGFCDLSFVKDYVTADWSSSLDGVTVTGVAATEGDTTKVGLTATPIGASERVTLKEFTVTIDPVAP